MVVSVRCFFCFPCPLGQFDHNLLLESGIKSLFRHRCQPPLFQGQSEIANPSDYARGAIWPGQPGPGEEMTKTHESNQRICCTEGGSTGLRVIILKVSVGIRVTIECVHNMNGGFG